MSRWNAAVVFVAPVMLDAMTGSTAPADIHVPFRVNLKIQILKEIWNVGGILEVRGDFQGWTDGDSLTTVGVDSVDVATFLPLSDSTRTYAFFENPPGGSSNGYEALAGGKPHMHAWGVRYDASGGVFFP